MYVSTGYNVIKSVSVEPNFKMGCFAAGHVLWKGDNPVVFVNILYIELVTLYLS